MRWLLILLVLANLSLFAWWQGWIEQPQPVPREVGRDRVRVVPIEKLEGTPTGTVPPASPGNGLVAPAEPASR